MFFSWFSKKRGLKEHKEETKKAFDVVKNDVNKISEWINHLDKKRNLHNSELKRVEEELRKDISLLREEIEELKVLHSLKMPKKEWLSKQLWTAVHRQTAVQGVQTPVQTAVQRQKKANFLQFLNLTAIERAIVWILLNSDLKLSYEDLAAMLGKGKSTIRSQMNTIKQKSEGLIEEIIEKDGKKRLFISEKTKEILIKNAKVRVRKKKKSKRKEE